MSAELLALALDGIASAWESDAADAYDRSRRLRDPDEAPEPIVGLDYELGYAEGRHSSLGRAARDVRAVAAAVRNV